MSQAWWFIPGFLGNESHFGELLNQFEDVTVLSLKEFSDASDLKAAAQLISQKILSSGVRPHLVGYSLGGRLALQMALEAPGTFKSVTAISSHPGFSDESLKSSRIKEDQAWAKLLLSDWNEFWKKWNERGVLKDTPIPHLEAPSISEKNQWAHILENWSTGHQKFLPPLLKNSLVPISAIMGENDKAYLEHLKLFPDNIKKTIIPSAGHRIPLEEPSALIQELKAFAQENS